MFVRVHRASASSGRRLRDRLWLNWCPSPDESEILMYQQGWIMHSPPLPLLSSSLLHLLSWVVRLSFHHSCHIWRHLQPLHPPLPLFPSRKRWHHVPHCRRCSCCWCLVVLWSTLLSALAAKSFLSFPMRFQVRLYRGSFVEACAQGVTRNVFSLWFGWHFAPRMAKCVDVCCSLSNYGRMVCSHWLVLTVTCLTDRSH